ncbi:MAG: hypothetical protein GPJ54_10070, partial [Candidatus Heimdallarchaeota archaeon]|nr:hypothetical protein [Candidatus Heimdallarchaeota archaeon]
MFREIYHKTNRFTIKKRSGSFALLVILLFMTSAYAQSSSLSTRNSISPSDINIEEIYELEDKKLNSFKPTSFNINALANSKANVIVIYDSNDLITTNAALLFDEFLKYETRIEKYPISNIFDVEVALQNTRKDQIVIFLAHGLPDEFKLGNKYYPWSQLTMNIEESSTNHFLIASCFSSSLDSKTDLKIKGLEGLIDYQAAVPILSIYALDFLYEIDNFERTSSLELIKEYLNNNENDVISRLITPVAPLAGIPKTLQYRLVTTNDDVNKLIDGMIEWLRNQVLFVIESINTFMRSVFPEQILNAFDTSFDSSGIGLDINLFDFPIEITENIDPQFTLNHEISKDFKKKVDIIIIPDKVNLTLTLELFKEEMVEGQTNYEVSVFGIRGSAKLKSTKPFVVHLPIGPISIVLDIDFQIMLAAEILFKYESHDPTYDYDNGDISNNTVLYDQSNNLAAIVGYATVENLLDEELVIESWFGMPNLGIGPWLRVYGLAEIKIAFRLGSPIEKALEAASHSQKKISESESKVKNDVAWSLGQASIMGVFSGSGDGLILQLNTLIEIGPNLEIEIGIGDNLTFILEGKVVIRYPFSVTGKWDDSGLYFTKMEIYYPKIIVDFTAKVEFEFKVFGKKFTLKIEYNYDFSHYLPNGIKEDLEPGQTFSDYNIYEIKEYNHPEGENQVTTDSAASLLYCSLIYSIADVYGAPVVCNDISAIITYEATVRNGTVSDSEPPIIEIMTPNSNRDDVLTYGEYEGQPKTFFDFIDKVTSVTSNFVKVVIGKFLEGNFFENNGSYAITIEKSKPIYLVGDEAVVDIYVFDPHIGSNTDSYVKKLEVEADFDPVELEATLIPDDLSYYSFGSHTVKPFKFDTKFRMKLDITFSQADVVVKDKLNNVIRTFRSSDYMTYGRTSANIVVDIPWMETNELIIELREMPADSCTLCFEAFAEVHVKSIEIKHKVSFTGDKDVTIDLSSMTNGALYLNQSYPEVTSEWGPSIGKTGYEGIWTLELPLHKYYVDNRIPQSGNMYLRVKATDDANLYSEITKVFQYYVPIDSASPEIKISDSKIQNASLATNINIATRGSEEYTFTFNEVEEIKNYQYSFGNQSSSYAIHTGINASTITDRLAFYSQESKVIKTISSGTSNQFKYTINQALTSNSNLLSFDMRTSGDYIVDIQLTSTSQLEIIRYQNGVTSTYQAGSVIYVNTTSFDVNDLDWTRINVPIEELLRSFSLNANATMLEAIYIQGSMEFDSIILNSELVMDSNSLTSWSTTITNPEGSSLTNPLVYKPEVFTVSHTWNEVPGSRQLDTNGAILTMQYKLSFDTTQLSDGEYYAELSVDDNFGYSASGLYRIIIDNTAPTD